jgi:predicted DNA-binding transcriptional regulator YafY
MSNPDISRMVRAATTGAVMRHEPAERVLQLALAMQGSRMGVSLSDIEAQFGVGRRTAQRLRDAVARVYPQVEQLVDAEARPRWRIPATGVVTPGALAADDIAELEGTARYLRQRNLRKRAAALERIAAKLKAALPGPTRARLEPDIEALLQAEGLAMRPGPRPLIAEEVIDTIRLALKQGREIYLHYRSRHTKRSSGRRLQPYGLLFGKQHYLVGMSPDRHPGEARLFALAHIRRVACLDTSFVPDPGFSLQRFAEQSFGVFQEEPQDVVWRFAPEVAEAACDYHFHPSQTIRRQRDGSVLLSFRAGGLMEMCWHLYTWGAHVEVVKPTRLRQMMRAALQHRNFEVEGA